MKNPGIVLKRTVLITVLMFLIAAVAPAALAQQPVEVFVNGAPLQTDQTAFLDEISGVTYVPLRAMAEELQSTVIWDEAAQTITVTRSGNTAVLKISSDKVSLNGVEKTLDGPVFIYQNSGRCVVPLRFFADILPFRIQVSATAGIGIFDDQSNLDPGQ